MIVAWLYIHLPWIGCIFVCVPGVSSFKIKDLIRSVYSMHRMNELILVSCWVYISLPWTAVVITEICGNPDSLCHSCYMKRCGMPPNKRSVACLAILSIYLPSLPLSCLPVLSVSLSLVLCPPSLGSSVQPIWEHRSRRSDNNCWSLLNVATSIPLDSGDKAAKRRWDC